MALDVFGPVPSRRLGRSIGINNIPPKTCSYGCIYCQVGRTTHLQTQRQTFFEPDELFRQVRDKLNQLHQANESIDFLTVVPDGEPTLDLQLGTLVDKLKTLDLPVAVITNASLLWEPSVRHDLMSADWVSLKIDAVTETLWRKINRPARDLDLPTVLEGLGLFAKEFSGTLVTESMFVKDLNEHLLHASQLAEFIKTLNPEIAYIAIPTRPPAVRTVKPADSEALARIYHTFKRQELNAEYLIGYEGNAFASSGNVKDDLLSITAVHPMRQDAVHELLRRTHAPWQNVEDLLSQNQLVKIEFDNSVYYARQLESRT